MRPNSCYGFNGKKAAIAALAAIILTVLCASGGGCEECEINGPDDYFVAPCDIAGTYTTPPSTSNGVSVEGAELTLELTGVSTGSVDLGNPDFPIIQTRTLMSYSGTLLIPILRIDSSRPIGEMVTSSSSLPFNISGAIEWRTDVRGGTGRIEGGAWAPENPPDVDIGKVAGRAEIINFAAGLDAASLPCCERVAVTDSKMAFLVKKVGGAVQKDLGLGRGISFQFVGGGGNSFNECGSCAENSDVYWLIGPETSSLTFDLGTAQSLGGTIKGKLKSELPLTTADGNDVQQALVELYQQVGSVREQNKDETIDDYIEFLESEGRTLVNSTELQPSDNGSFSFGALPLAVSDTDSAFYTVQVSNAQTEVLDTDNADITRTIEFLKTALPNLTPDEAEPFTENEVPLTPLEIFAVELKVFPTLGGPLDENPEANGGGMRIFPGRSSPNDFSRNILLVSAQINPQKEGIDVCFRSFDVDDPTGDNKTVDANAEDGNDNRGLLDEDGNAPEGSRPTDAGGFAGRLGKEYSEYSAAGEAVCAKTDGDGEATVILAVTFAPGDNFKVAVGFDEEEVKGIDENTVPADNAKAIPDFNGKVSETLYVWRKVHVEVDSMGIVRRNFVRGRIDSVKQNDKICEFDIYDNETTTLLDVGKTLPDDFDRFEGGRIRIAGIGDFEVLCNTDNNAFDDDVTVRGLVPGNAAGRGYILVDDDDFNTNDDKLDGDTAENVSRPDTRLLQDSDDPGRNIFAPAFVRPTYDVGDNNDLVRFRLNSPGEETALLPTYDFDSIRTEADELFWTVYLLGAYQHTTIEDGDPLVELIINGVTLGIVDALQGVGASVFQEGIKEVDGSPGVTEAHEIGHLFNAEHEDGAIMDAEISDLFQRFSIKSLNKIRLVDHP